ncbi:MAG TPA: UvrD-helicase domain-containing protein [Blastocatellia bacterium]|nr:UvrD-helicase domain-containing protein [Blastocatellia bacterium]
MSVVIERKTHELKPEQQLAAHTLDRHVSVTAGPGAGKTTVLVERYLEILRTEDITVDQIVAITFTNRAANEMRERLRKELDALLSAAAPEQRARWMRHKRTLDGAIITTIHGFCARLLREFPVEADLDPQFVLLDAHRSAMLEDAVAEEVLTRFISEEHPAITELAAAVGRARLARGLIDVYRSIRNQGLTLDRITELSATCHKTLGDFNAAVEELSGRVREFIQARGLTPATDIKQREARDRWPRLLELLKAAPGSTSLAEVIDDIHQFRDQTRPAISARTRDLVETLDELIWEKNLRGRVPAILLDLHATRYASELIRVVAQIERRLDEEKRMRSALDFDDLQLRALRLLEERHEVLRRTSGRYRFFLVDEFQDTNGLQRDLMATLALGGADFSQGSRDFSLREQHRVKSARPANLFIVGDRKQSIYGFRGADVDVFREMTSRIEARDGLSVPLNLNFRSQRPLIRFFNFLFERIFEHDGTIADCDLNELGYVEHEASVGARNDEDAPPLVELLIDLRPDHSDEGQRSEQKPRERDAEQLAAQIISLVGTESISDGEHGSRKLEHRDIALLFRAMTEAHIYESAFRRAGIPYVTVEGKGFYAREEITDLVQLLRFLDNKTDEVALAAVVRSPLCGISDDTLLALRCAPSISHAGDQAGLHKHGGVRPLLEAIRNHEQIEFIEISERQAIDDARDLLEELIGRAKRSRISELLRFAVESSEYRAVAAANFDGAQRLANIEKLFTLAERFERSGAYLIRDFVRFVRDFEETGGRESEGQIDDSADAVRIMSIHQSKGLEFPVVIIPDLHRQPDNRREWWALDRYRGLTTKVPDGRGRLVAGATFTAFAERARRREQFESMRLLYVAATRAENRLILSGAAKDLASLRNSWLERISKALGIGSDCASGLLKPADDVNLLLTLNLLDKMPPATSFDGAAAPEAQPPQPGDERVPLLEPIRSERSTALHRFSVTQLLNYQRCPRQYYFDRVLHAPGDEELAVWNDAEAPEPPANLTAALRGAVIHNFCEKHREGEDTHELLKTCVEAVLRQRAAELAERLLEIDPEKAIHDLMPLAQNYVASRVRERIEATRGASDHESRITHQIPLGVLSEQRFRLRRPLGILTGTIDKLLISLSAREEALDIEIIDFKTNRFRGPRTGAGANRAAMERNRGSLQEEQLAFSFLEAAPTAKSSDDLLIRTEVQAVAADYQIQMQAYALAALELIPEASNVRVTLHFLDPDVEVSLPEELLDRDACARAIDETMQNIVSSSTPESFPPRAADHCRMCSFVDLCPPGRQWLRTH